MSPSQTLVLFDIDNTLTPPMGEIADSMLQSLHRLRACKNVQIGVVGGSNREKALKQLGEGPLLSLFDWAFHENGAVLFQKGTSRYALQFEDQVPHMIMQALHRFLFGLLLETPAAVEQTGTFIERRNCMINFSPVGRQATPRQRKAFARIDAEIKLRENWAKRIREAFPELDCAVGGEISIDIFPRGFDKTLAIGAFETLDVDAIHFFGDSVQEGGNDHAIFNHPSVVGHAVTGWEDCRRQVDTLTTCLRTWCIPGIPRK